MHRVHVYGSYPDKGTVGASMARTVLLLLLLLVLVVVGRACTDVWCVTCPWYWYWHWHWYWYWHWC